MISDTLSQGGGGYKTTEDAFAQRYAFAKTITPFAGMTTVPEAGMLWSGGPSALTQ